MVYQSMSHQSVKRVLNIYYLRRVKGRRPGTKIQRRKNPFLTLLDLLFPPYIIYVRVQRLEKYTKTFAHDKSDDEGMK